MKHELLIYCISTLFLFSLSSCGHKSGRRTAIRQTQQHNRIEQHQEPVNVKYNNTKGKTIIKMTEQNGVYLIPCKINGYKMEFIFDTGASSITMSLTEAMFLYKQGKLTDDDFIGTQQYQIANGNIEEGTVVKLKTVEIGNRILYNVEASIIHNSEAPLLLGQSVLAKFGKISIDYQKNEISFE